MDILDNVGDWLVGAWLVFLNDCEKAFLVFYCSVVTGRMVNLSDLGVAGPVTGLVIGAMLGILLQVSWEENEPSYAENGRPLELALVLAGGIFLASALIIPVGGATAALILAGVGLLIRRAVVESW